MHVSVTETHNLGNSPKPSNATNAHTCKWIELEVLKPTLHPGKFYPARACRMFSSLRKKNRLVESIDF